MSDRQAIRDFYGKILGYITEESNGNKTATDFYGRILGKYNKQLNHTTDFYGRILTKGDSVVSLIYNNQNNK